LLSADGRRLDQPDDEQWESLLDLAAGEWLLPALWSAGLARGWFASIPTDARAALESHLHRGTAAPPLLLEDAYDDNRARTTSLLAEGEVVLRALGGAGISAIPLKGWHTILADWWPDPANRVLRDLDVLVPEADADRAVDALATAGFTPMGAPLDDYADHQRPAMSSPEHPMSIEVHTALAVSRWRAVLPAEDVFASVRDGRMTTTHAVVHSIVHAQLHDEAHLLRHLPLRALHELAVLSRSPVAATVDWDEVHRRFEVGGRRARAAIDAHLGLARDLFAADVPAPRSELRVKAHRTMCGLELVNPRAASAYRSLVFLPRAWGAARMHRLYGEGNVWRLRASHLSRRIRSGKRAGGSGTSP
jgi:hypothetical protein